MAAEGSPLVECCVRFRGWLMRTDVLQAEAAKQRRMAHWDSGRGQVVRQVVLWFG